MPRLGLSMHCHLAATSCSRHDSELADPSATGEATTHTTDHATTSQPASRAQLSTAPAPGCPLGEAGRQHGRELITALRHARHVLRGGLQNLGAVRDEAVYAQRAFYPLIRLLDDVDLILNTRSKTGASTAKTCSCLAVTGLGNHLCASPLYQSLQ